MNNIEYNSRTWAEVDLSALKYNLDLARGLTNKPVMCVIKANAYGHGAVECGKFLQNNGASAFAVACLEEAIELRENSITLPILILGYTQTKYADAIAKYDITQTLVDFEYAKELSITAKALGVTVKAHIKLDTGMSRSGLFAQGEEHIKTAIEYASQICTMPALNICGMYTHLSVADVPSQIEFTNWQIDNYIAVRNGLEKRGHHLECCHVSNSAAIMNYKRAYFDMVREGIILYGLYPDSLPVQNEYLRPVMTLKSRVSQIRDLPKGATIGYGRTFKTERNMKSAVVLAGYADGYPRRLSNHAYVVINGNKCNQVGTVCMDVIMVDATDAEIKRNDEVILFGNGGMSIEAVSQIVGTINYELTCLVTPRAKRKYINGT